HIAASVMLCLLTVSLQVYVRVLCVVHLLFFFDDTATTEIYTLSLHDALPISGVGCMVNGCLGCATCQADEEQYCPDTVFTYGNPEKSSPTGISQGGYANNIVVRDHFAVHIPKHLSFQQAAPLLCAGITTYSPLMKYQIKKGDKVGVAGIGGLGHMAIKIAVSKGAEVYGFT